MSVAGIGSGRAAHRGIEQPVWARLLVAGLVAGGVRDVVISPGSRSTPLVLALLDESRLRRHVLVDERSAAFFALGQARVSGLPTVVVRTSGSAGANDFPAVVEAAASGLPLVVITADRPPELHYAQGNQTIDQLGLFGVHVRAFFELGSAETTRAGLRAVRRTAVQAVHRSIDPEPGPVHLNVRFRKPLEPPAALSEALGESPDDADTASALRRDVETVLGRPPARVERPVRWWPGSLLALTAKTLRSHERGLIVVGPAPGPSQLAQRELFDLALLVSRQAGYPIYAEAASQLRFRARREQADHGWRLPLDEAALGALDARREHPDPLVRRDDALLVDELLETADSWPDPSTVCFVDGLDAILRAGSRLLDESARSEGLPPALRPSFILQLGRPPVSAAWGRLLEHLDAWGGCEHWAVAPWGWPDAASTVTRMIACDARAGLDLFAEALLDEPRIERAASAWIEVWHRLAAASRRAADLALEEAAARAAEPAEAAAAGIAEGEIARIVAASLPEEALLMLGNSLTIRTVDQYVDGTVVPDDIDVLAQRGASGIDGLVSGAAGAAAVSGRPTVLLLGDISLFHDAGGLAALAAVEAPCAVVVVNNGGGRIFEQLPIASRDVDMTPWTTPHRHRFEHLARFYGLAYRHVEDPGALRAALTEVMSEPALESTTEPCSRPPRRMLIEARAPEHDAADTARRVAELLEPAVRAEAASDAGP